MAAIRSYPECSARKFPLIAYIVHSRWGKWSLGRSEGFRPETPSLAWRRVRATVPMLDETPLSSCTPEQQVHLGLAQVYVSVFVISSHIANDNPVACLEATLHFDEVTGTLPKMRFDLRRAPPVGIEHEQSPFCIWTTRTKRGFLDVDHVSQPARR